MSTPGLVSVIIPAYNKAEYTRRCVESVLAQSYQHIEVIVVDDGSVDNTASVMKSFGERIRYVLKKNGGACSARNEGIRQARGEFLAFLDCDDLYEISKIEQSITCLVQQPAYGFVHTDAYFCDQHDVVVGQYKHPLRLQQGHIANQLVMGNFICNSTVVVRRQALDQAGYFDETIFPPADWDMWLRLAQVSQAGFVDCPLTKYRVTDNFIINRLDQSLAEELFVVEQFFKREPAAGALKIKALSNLHTRFAQSYWVKNEMNKSWQQLMFALKKNPLNWKPWVLLVARCCCPSLMEKNLKRRILRVKVE